MSKKRRLGRGLAELLAVDPDPQHQEAEAGVEQQQLWVAPGWMELLVS